MVRFPWFSSLSNLLLAWHECGENPVFFCYRMGQGVAAMVRPASRELPLAELAGYSSSRNATECSNPSGIFSTPCMTSQD